ncbi:metallophosphoesterase [Bacteroides sp.]|uniref:metallophosphoesterase n=1 Tax=Bacteroides sp. TaxID=29523 RepID=UPI0026309720|nr:metallophosphoesterase [Bacteroides sp.]MDD3041128.1 metallophosphoesterase [Bacteroides sp.]
MNNEFHTDFGESKFRKQWTYFNDGRMYEKELRKQNVHKWILSISDLHVPYQLPIDTFVEYSGKIDTLVLNGDILDCQALSKFNKVYRDSPMDEIIQARQYLIDLIDMLMPNEIYVTVGNHDVRMQAYLSKALDSDLLELMPMTALDLIVEDGMRRYDKRSKAKIWYDPLIKVFPDIKFHFDGGWSCKVGKSWFCHPMAFSSGNLKTAERAMEYFLKSDDEPFDSLILAHTHRTGDLKKGRITIFEQGACCRTEKMDYTDGRLTDPQQKGFILVAQDKEGNLLYDATKRIIL